jgi:hypothetical protein
LVQIGNGAVNSHLLLGLDEDDDDLTSVVDNDSGAMKSAHVHTTLKASMPTRWNSSLTMVQSIIDVGEKVINSVLQRCGHHEYEYTITPLEKDILLDLNKFLSPFSDLTKLVSDRAAMASLIPIIKNEIRSSCATNQRDSRVLASLKAKVLNKLDFRLSESESIKIASLMDPDVKEIMDMTIQEKVN